MIIRGLATLAVIGGLGGMLWSAPPEAAEALPAMAVAVAEPAPGDRGYVPLEEKVEMYIEQVRAAIAELERAGRHEEAERLEQEARERIAGVKELSQGIIDAKRRIDELHAAGRHEEAEELQREGMRRLAELREEGRPEHLAVIEELEMQGHLAKVREKIEQLHQAGRHEDAERLERGVRQRLMMAREHPQPPEPGIDEAHRRLQEMQHEIQELHAMGRHEEAEHVEREARMLMERVKGFKMRGGPEERGPHPMEMPQDMKNRLHHMFKAAENLDGAGMHDQAQQLRMHAEELHREMKERCEHREPHPEQHVEMIMHELHELRAEVHELIELVRDLHRRVDEITQ